VIVQTHPVFLTTMGKSDRAMEWVLGKPLPKPVPRRSRSPCRNRKVIVHVETSESECKSDTSTDGSHTEKKVRFKDDINEFSDAKDGARRDQKKSAMKKDSGRDKQSDTRSEESAAECACCEGKNKAKDKSKGEGSKKDSPKEDHSKPELEKKLAKEKYKGAGQNQRQQAHNKSVQAKFTNSNPNQPQPSGPGNQNQPQIHSKSFSNQSTGQNPNRPNTINQHRVISTSDLLPDLTRNMVGRMVQTSR
jgi:hypothetical protein